MNNFTVLENNQIQTPFGIMSGVTTLSCYESGELKSVRLNEKNMTVTHAGELVPVYTETPRRKYKHSIEFFKNGLIKSICLEEPQEIITPIGEFPAEQVTFHETGELKRFFPLDGKISGFWSEEDERTLNIPLNFDLGFTAFTAMLNGVCFYKSGNIRSITLFPGESIEVLTTYGTITTKNGLSLYESGQLESLEPQTPVLISTPIGTIAAYDPNALGINADSNSLRLDDTGRVIELITTLNHIAVQQPDGQLNWFKPIQLPHPLEEDKKMTVGLHVSFNYEHGTVTIKDEIEHTFLVSECAFTVVKTDQDLFSCSPSDCANCSLCEK